MPLQNPTGGDRIKVGVTVSLTEGSDICASAALGETSLGSVWPGVY